MTQNTQNTQNTQGTQGTQGKPKQGKSKGNGSLKKPGPNKRKQPAKLRHDVSDDPMHLNFQGQQDFGGHRPPRCGQLAVNWEIVEREYITGYIEEDPKTKDLKRIYPSLRELGKRHSLKLPTMNYHSRRRNWIERRQKFVAQMKTELDEQLAKARGLDTGTVVAMLNTFIRRFGVAIEKDSIARTTIKDLEMALRLRSWVKKESDALSQPKTTLSLETLQARHRELRERAVRMGPELTGFVPGRMEREAEALKEQEERDREMRAAAEREAVAAAAPQRPVPPLVDNEPQRLEVRKKPSRVSAARRAAIEARLRAGLTGVPGHAVGGERQREAREAREASADAWAQAEFVAEHVVAREADPWVRAERAAIAAC